MKPATVQLSRDFSRDTSNYIIAPTAHSGAAGVNGGLMKTAEILKSQDIKPTVVRMKIYDYLISNKNHPTIDTVYKNLQPKIPTLSKTSVYNTMELLAAKKLVQTITIEENETRYDADTSDHGHFKCTACGKVYDFHIDLSGTAPDLPEGFTIDERHVYYKGLCGKCVK